MEEETGADPADTDRRPHPLSRLLYFCFRTMVGLDPMHTIGRVIECIFRLLTGDSFDDSNRVHLYEAQHNQRAFGRSCVLTTRDRGLLQAYLDEVAKHLPSNQAGSRFRRLLDPSKQARTHHYFLFAGARGGTSCVSP